MGLVEIIVTYFEFNLVSSGSQYLLGDI